MPWDYADIWENGLKSLVCLEKLFLRSWHCLREEASEEDLLVRTWLIDPPPELKEVVIWTKIPANETVDTYTGTQRLVQWRREEMRGGWHWQKTFEQIGVTDFGDFM
jgi:hypothetical protein